MQVSSTFRKLALATAISSLAAGAMAATQGGIGATSTGDFDITYVQGGEVRLWGLEDMSFTSLATDADKTETVTVCTYNNSTTQVNFRVNSDNEFALVGSNGEGATVPYTLSLADKGGPIQDFWGEGGLASDNQGSYQYLSQGTNTTGCSGAQQTTDLTVILSDASGDVSSGIYRDTVTVTIQPI
ncbi:hypothetical protein CI610_00380 [invertebrate metagenome]|uniref:Spore coat protein U domain-containing protein n=1 Tax=invertebrate metagenome TaxID=1711999 RepID=A0A2H9TBL6_9ZZZZ